MRTAVNISFFAIALVFVSCGKPFDYSPYAIDFDDENSNVNRTNISRLLPGDTCGTVRIAFTGDTHRFFDELNDFVDAVNNLNPKVDFVIHVGDLADFGLPQQYLWANSLLLNLDCPYFVCLGNHDLVGNGGLAYKEMFGDYNFSFIYKRVKFVFINTNGRETGFDGTVPDNGWLNSRLVPADNFDYAVVVFHVPPGDPDFDPALEEKFRKTVAEYDNVIFAVHGHWHAFDFYKPYSDSIPYISVFGVQNRKFNVITISGGEFELEDYEF